MEDKEPYTPKEVAQIERSYEALVKCYNQFGEKPTKQHYQDLLASLNDIPRNVRQEDGIEKNENGIGSWLAQNKE